MSGRQQEWGSKPSHAKLRSERAEFGDEQVVQQRRDARDEPSLRYDAKSRSEKTEFGDEQVVQQRHGARDEAPLRFDAKSGNERVELGDKQVVQQRHDARDEVPLRFDAKSRNERADLGDKQVVHLRHDAGDKLPLRFDAKSRNERADLADKQVVQQRHDAGDKLPLRIDAKLRNDRAELGGKQVVQQHHDARDEVPLHFDAKPRNERAELGGKQVIQQRHDARDEVPLRFDAKSRNERAELGDKQVVQQRHDAQDEPPLHYVTKSRNERAELGGKQVVQQRQHAQDEPPLRYVAKSRNERAEFGDEQLVQQRHDAQYELPLRYQENLAPHQRRIGVQQNRERYVPSELLQRRVHGWHTRSGHGERRELEWRTRSHQDEQIYSRTGELVGRSDKGLRMNERVSHAIPPPVVAHRKRHVSAEYEDFEDEAVGKSKHVYGYDDHVQFRKHDYSDGGFMVDNERVAMVKNSVPAKDVLDPQLVRMHQDHGQGQGYQRRSLSSPTMEIQRSMEVNDPHLVRQHKKRGHEQGYGQSSRGYPTMEMRNSLDESDYQEVVSPERFYTEKRYKDKEKYVYPAGKSHLPLSPTFQSRDYDNHYMSRGTQGTSSGVIRDEYPGGFQSVDTFGGYQRRTQNASKSLVMKGYGQRPQMLHRKDYEDGYVDMEHHQYDPYGSTWSEQEDYDYGNGEFRGKGDPGYISHDVLYREEHTHSQADFEHRYIERPFIAKHHVESPVEAEGQNIYRSNTSLRGVDIGHKEKVSGYVDSTHLGRAFDTQKQGIGYPDSEYAPADLGRRASEELQPNKTLHEQKRTTYGYPRDVNVARSQRERVNTSSKLVDPTSTQRPVGQAHRYADEQIAYNGSDVYADEQNFYDGSAKRKYLQDEEPGRYSLGTKVPNKRNAFSRSQEVEGSGLEWGDTSSRHLHPKVPSRHKPNLFLEAKDVMDEVYRHADSRQYSVPNQGNWRKMQEQPIKSSEPGRKYMKTHPTSESSKGYGQSHYIDHGCEDENHIHKKQYVDKRNGNDNDIGVVTQDGNLSGDQKGAVVYELNEDTEGFKRSVQAAFLMYSKILNENPSTRRLYRDQGRSGFLFCIVCGRSASKVFRDTVGLAKHALMARKPRLRAGHLGLCRAICVLMGWSSEIPLDIASWVPQSLPKPMAMARKEDLILWQPVVVVHNISLSNSNHKEWKVIGLEALENIVRAKALIMSKIRISLGHPGDQSVMLVKFLGTFTGLQEAEKLHTHFTSQQRGRSDFEHAIHAMNSSNEESAKTEADEESLLYGYIGVADDLDRVDFETKKIIKVKSKKEIQDIADAPLRAETTPK